MKRLAMLWVAAAWLAGCAGQPVEERPPLARRVAELGKEGQDAYFKGDLARARRLFELALRDARQVEDSAGVVAMSLNLARVQRESGDSAGALTRLEQLPDWQRGTIPAALAGELDLASATLLADSGRRDVALVRLAALRDRCAADCELAIGIDSLQARLLLESGAAQSALDLAGQALGRYPAHRNRAEQANLLRVQGEASRALGDLLSSQKALEAALALDKALAQPAKIVLDLQALAETALAAGDASAHAHYLARRNEILRARQTGAPQ